MRMGRIRAHFLRQRVNEHSRGVRRWIVYRIIGRFSAVIERTHVAGVDLGVIGAAICIIALGWRHLGILEQLHAAQARILINVARPPAPVYPQALFAIYIHHHVSAINHARYYEEDKQIIMNALAQRRPCFRLFMSSPVKGNLSAEYGCR